MLTRLAYGKTGLMVDLNDAWDVQVVEPRFVPGLPDPLAAIQAALRNPIGCPPLVDLARAGERVGIIFNDITRPTPNPLLLRALLGELSHIPKENITLFIALGTHRPNTGEELHTMLGDLAFEGYSIVQNHSFDQGTQVNIGKTSRGNEIWINRELMECPVKILTGFIEPHFFAGFSGAGKAVMPGMAGQETVLRNHSAQNIAHPKATWGNTWGNPIWEEVREAARLAGASFLLNVTLNRDKAVTGVFTGDLDEAHTCGVDFVRQTAMVAVNEPFDIVVTTNSGYPLDLNLYQAVKGMSAAAQVVRPGGAILCAAECWDGIPDHGLYGQLLREASSPQELLDRIMAPGFLKQDQWQAQIQAQIQLKAEVYVHSSYLSEDQIRGALLKPAASVESTLAELVSVYGPSARICLLPEGPQTVPYLAQS
jgi:nickel-dependent lactate racemase